MHIVITLYGHDYSSPSTYDVTVKGVSPYETKQWSTQLGGATPEPIANDINQVRADTDCRDHVGGK